MTLGLSDCEALGPSTKHTAFHLQMSYETFSLFTLIFPPCSEMFIFRYIFHQGPFCEAHILFIYSKAFLSREDNFVPYGKFLDHIVTVKIHFKGYCHLILKLTY